MRRSDIPPPVAAFRCDASPVIGAGHVTRCLALAEALLDAGWRVIFATGPQTPASVPALAASGFDFRILDEPDAGAAINLGHRLGSKINLLVLDHYGLDAEFERACRSWAHRILVLDDRTGRRHDCDFLLDAAATDATIYAGRAPDHARILAGPAFALMRRSFVMRREAALARRDGRAANEILISFGATDPANIASMTLDALNKIDTSVLLTVAMSSTAPHIGDVRRRLNGRIRLVVDSADMAGLMTEADMAIGAAGVTAFERAALGLPSILVTLADNQRGISRLMVEAGAALDGGVPDENFASRLPGLVATLLNDSLGRQRMAQAAASLVDGRGPLRLLIAMAGDVAARDGARVCLRPAEANDESWLLQLQRLPQTRRYFKNPAAPAADEHRRWMERVLNDPNILLLIVEVEGVKAGMLRLDLVDHQGPERRYTVSIALHPAFYARGIAAAALSLARRLRSAAIFDAEIMPDNTASKRLFLHAGFVQLDDNLYRSSPG